MLYSPLQRSTVEIREARDRAVDDSTHSEGVAADWMQEILQPLKSPCATVVDENLDEVLHCVCAEDPLIRGALSTSLGGDGFWYLVAVRLWRASGPPPGEPAAPIE